ncbi:MAG: Dibenzothiophene desulfurization enzyme C [Chroococcidiopsis cubana SAG 39.79]|uniref:Dibenzothiophene monooxygenase n=1 Tax=Chroococcidiopsis cubana SAG 39.79 TaxID=388085 RepID=A0AB37UFH5_9CYAN|nr:SfnB family sulfur acquisition oxidoreductase [Chroococcidiopsis cubana]MDZ4876583.1 Dibenzothiophene desulfurization enzyme C [Chroococcidiopsis cubana SAG 39.79]PSB59907.1 SfnB family sulfur acquisition oxidoreductase [Chroococcidiopsis cubana CCALA 043]RUT10355.1 SfnB family sulfur acquisition oxidoreductase [Chroococcidiopsis cubana SAG 39.79]
MTTLVDVETQPRASVIENDEQAIAVAHELAAQFVKEDSERDRQKRLPVEEVKKFSQSGLWGITVPREYGGAFVSNVTLAEVVKIISEADPSLGQIPQNHLYMVEVIRLDGTEAQKRFFFDLVLQGQRFGNAFSEIGTKSVTDVRTRLERSGDEYVLNGRKYYSAGALLAHWIPVIASNDDGKTVIAFVERGAEGLTLLDDWTSFGQRTTASGTTILENVKVKPEHVISHYLAFERATPMGAVAQIIQAAVDVGIAKAAVRDTIYFVRNHTRPWVDSNLEYGYEDPLSIYNLGQVQIQVHAAEALLRRADEFIDRANQSDLAEAKVVEASIAVAEAKALATEASLLATNKLFELAGTKSTLQEYNYDRHWRNARAHTLHDPVRWKYFAVGNYFLNGVNPPRHPWL